MVIIILRLAYTRTYTLNLSARQHVSQHIITSDVYKLLYRLTLWCPKFVETLNLKLQISLNVWQFHSRGSYFTDNT